MLPARLSCLLLLLVPGLLAACSAPYRAPVVVRGSAGFPGIAGIVAQSGGRPVDVLVVHGMCTRDAAWAERKIDSIAGSVEDNAPAPATAAVADGAIEVLERTRRLAGGTVRFHALLWSPLTAPFKRQLDYDHRAEANDCARERECRPRRALLNGMAKDWLLDDCLADVVIYQGAAGAAIRAAMADAVMRVLATRPEADGPLVVVAESLGSKMLFDALSGMLESSRPQARALGRQAARRLGLLFMAGNQLPILGLGEQAPGAGLAAGPGADALQRFLALRRRQPDDRAGSFARLHLVAFNDPNDLLSYRLLPARYAAEDVAVTDVLVSNDASWFGLIENPVSAHLDYLANPAVGALLACGHPRAAACP